jgi:hypothetical protein
MYAGVGCRWRSEMCGTAMFPSKEVEHKPVTQNAHIVLILATHLLAAGA